MNPYANRIAQPEFDILIADNWEAFVALQSYVSEEKFEYTVLDLETDGKQERTAKIHGIGLCFKDNEAFYIPIRDNQKNLVWTTLQLAIISDWIYEVCRKSKLVGHNIIYDVLVWESNFNTRLNFFIHSDTILQKHAIDEERPFALKEIAVKYLGPWADKAQDALYENIIKNDGSVTADNLEMWKADLDVLAEYCCYDVLLTRKLFFLFDEKLKEEGLENLFYEEETMPLYREVTIDMKRRGFPVDVKYFEKLSKEIAVDIIKFQDEVMEEISSLIEEYVVTKLQEEVPVKSSGNFPKVLAESMGIPLPQNKKTGAITLAQKELEKLVPDARENYYFYMWLIDPENFKCPASDKLIKEAQSKIYLSRTVNANKRYVFNLKSDDHLRWLFFTKLGITPVKHTETGEPSVDAETLEEISGQNAFADKIIDFKKLCKLESTYIKGILDRHVNGIIYTSMLQFGTTSGRYSSRDPNLQNNPRVKDEESKLSEIVLKYANAIKRGFIAPEGYSLVNADYSALEPTCFAHVSGDEKLRDVFRKGEDLYSTVAIHTWGLYQYSADKKAHNYLGKLSKETRQKTKVFCLAVAYGAEAGRISQAMGCDYQTADETIESYLAGFPDLRKYMDRMNDQVVRRGFVRSDFGRIRHLPQAKLIFEKYGKKILDRKWAKELGLGETRYKLKNALNNAKNFPIQGLAAHIVNRAMIATSREFKKADIDAHIVMQVHDEITCIAREDQAEMAKAILKRCMETTTKLSVPLFAEPVIASNWAEAK